MKTSSATNMTCLFYNCINLESIDLSNFDTSSVTLMSYMFRGCYSLKSIKFPEMFKPLFYLDNSFSINILVMKIRISFIY